MLNRIKSSAEQRYRSLFEGMTEGFALHEIVCDNKGVPCDYRFLEVNPAFERLTGLKQEKVVGRLMSEVLPDDDPTWVRRYGEVALTGRSASFQNYSTQLKRHYEVFAYCPAPQQFAVLFLDVTERKHLETALELAARFPEENPNPVMRLGEGHVVDFANPSAKELLKTQGCIGGGEAPPEIAEPAVAALKDGVPRQIEKTYSERTYLFSFSPIPQWSYVNLYAIDITDRKRAEEALRESESRERARAAEFEALMEAAPVGIFVAKDTECRWMSGNQAAYDLLRRPRGSNLSKSGREGEKPVNFRSMKDGKEIPLPELPMQKSAASGKAVRDHEMDFVFEDGVTVNILGNVVPLLDESGRPRGAVGTFLDITELKRTEEALRASEERFRALVTASSDVVYRMSPHWSEMRQLRGQNFIADTEAPNRNWLQKYIHPDDQSRVVTAINEAIRSKSVFELEHRVLRVDGSLGWTLSRAIPLQDANGEIVEWFGTATDVTERKRAEEALQASEQRFRVLAEAMPQIVWSAGATGAVEYVNPQTLRYGGVRLEDIGGWKWESFVHPDDLAPTAAGWRHALTAGESDQIEHRLRRADGEFRWHLTRAVPLRNEKGEVIHWIGTATDIHDQKMAEQELERRVAERTAELARSTALLETVTSNAPVVLFATDAKGTFTVHTGQAVTASGREPGELVGKNCRELLPGQVQTVEQIHRALAGETFTGILEGPHDRTFETRYNPLRDAHGNVTGMIAVALDITEAKRAKEGLEKANAYNRSLLEASLDPLVTISPDGKITDANSAAEKVTGCLRGELIGADFSDYFTDPEKARLGYQHVFKEGLVQDYELEIRHRDGTTTPVLYNASVYRDQGGEVVGVFAAARDITTRKRAEEEVRRLNEELEQRVRLRTAQLEASNKELESFSYSVSHDLRAPLRAVDGFSRILLEEYRSQLPSKAQRYLDFVRDGASHMGNLIDGLLALSRLGRQELKRRPVEVAEIVRQSMDDLQADVGGSAAEFVVGSLPSCDADPLLLRQVFVNLLSNALKFSRKQEKVRIQIGALRAHEAAQAPVQVLRLLDRHSWVYYVRDNGVGFDMRYADKLFGVFQRLHRQEEFKGTGIGLATVQQIIHKHGGQVWAEAEVGKGATFYFTLGQAIGESHNSIFGTPE
ncbi:MAG: PAS domain S-box protein [Terriglobia bacterium]|jgi:PAS domain S-box-containing protein